MSEVEFPLRVWSNHQQHPADGYGRVELPHALPRKSPNANRQWCWHFVFPQELLGHKDVRPTIIDTHVLNRDGRGVRSPADGLAHQADERQAETA